METYYKEINGVIEVWKNKGKILEGIKNKIFKEHVEKIAQDRLTICESCPLFDIKGVNHGSGY